MNNIILFLKKSKFKLNLMIISSWLLKIIFLSNLISVFIIIICKLFRLYNINISIWFISIFIGVLLGIIIGWSKCINILSTSKWLDDYLKNNDILSSALFCIERKNKGIFDKLIIEKANKISKKNIKIKWPTKNIKKPLLLCLISCFFCISLLLFWNPTYK